MAWPVLVPAIVLGLAYSPPPSGGRGGGGRGAARSAVLRPKSGRGRYQPPIDISSMPPKQRKERERSLDLFGAPGEWKARKGKREWSKYETSKYDDEGEEYATSATDDNRLISPADFAPKIWRAEAGGGKSVSWFAKAPTFESLGASEGMQAALAACGADRPSHVQASGFAPILRGDDVALADQTGSGKTLAYLGPIAQALRAIEEADGRTPNGHVRALVLTPTSELAQQVLSVAKQLSAGGARFRSTIITGEHKWRTQAKCADKGVELIVATPGRLLTHLDAEPNPSFSLASVRHLVLDEADLLFEDEEFDKIWERLRGLLPSTTATAFVTATLPGWLIERVQKELPLVKILKGSSLHRTAAGVRETLIDCSAGERVRGDGDAGFQLKATALVRELEAEPVGRTLIFCNTIESCRRVENFLVRRDRRGDKYNVFVFHGAIPAEARKRTLAGFTAPTHDADGYAIDDGAYGDAPLPRILVCTDRASRGMDFADVGHVVLFDFPRDGVEYVRRVGRVTRGTKAPGKVTSLVLGRQLAYARALMKINREGGAVDLDVHGSMAAADEQGAGGERGGRE